MTKQYIFILLTFFLISANSKEYNPDPTNLQNHIDTLTSKEFMGRKTGTIGEKITAQYILSYLSNSKSIKPYVPISNTFKAPFDIPISEIDLAKSSFKVGSNTLNFGEDYVPFVIGESSGKPLHFTEAIIASCDHFSKNNNFALNKLIILYEKECNNQLMEAELSINDLLIKLNGYAPQAILIVAKTDNLYRDETTWNKHIDPKSLKRWNNKDKSILVSQKLSNYSNQLGSLSIPAIYVAKNSILKIIQSINKKRKVNLIDNVSIQVSKKNSAISGDNLIFHIPGESKKNILITSHFDSFGLNNDGEVFPGADDNASGVALVLELAKNFANRKDKTRLKHGIIFAFVSGEEWGLWGSKALARSLQEKQLDKDIIANINLDSVGRSKNNLFYVLGKLPNPDLFNFFSKSSNDLITISNKIEFAYYKGSDHFSFHQVGIPSIDITSGKQKEWHTTQDLEKHINYWGMNQLLSTVTNAMLQLTSEDFHFEKSYQEYAPFPFSQTIKHNIEINIDPMDNSFSIIDSLGFNQLPKDLEITSHAQSISITLDGEIINYTSIKKNNNLLISPNYNKDNGNLTISYHVKIKDGDIGDGDDHFGGGSESPIIVSEEGIYLAPAGRWYPYANSNSETFFLKVTLPRNWYSITSGIKLRSVQENVYNREFWKIDYPSESIHLIAGKYKIKEELYRGVRLQTYFHAELISHENEYIEKLKGYLDLYMKRYGSYPFSKFAVVSNFFSTGYGMASYTLLDKNIIPYSFITEVSLGHEYAHNYWGNSVYVKWNKGNWCEGLTTYEADYLYSNLKSPAAGKNYRLTILRDYQNLVTSLNVFPLKEFINRFSPASRAIGYGKVAMVFHMLKRRIGEGAYLKSLSKIINTKSYQNLSYADLQTIFEEISKQDLSIFFKQWINRIDTPDINLSYSNSNNLLTITQNNDSAYDLILPVEVTYKDSTKEFINLKTHNLVTKYNLTHLKPIKNILLDPNFEVMRKLFPNENPANLAMIFGRTDRSYVSYLNNNDETNNKLKDVIKLLPGTKEEFALQNKEIISEINITNSNILFISNTQLNETTIQNILKAEPRIVATTKKIQIQNGGSTYNLNTDDFIILNILVNQIPVMLVISPLNTTPDSVNIGRKLSHYGKYSFLEFTLTGQKVEAQTWSIE